eukprot:g28459.t1
MEVRLFRKRLCQVLKGFPCAKSSQDEGYNWHHLGRSFVQVHCAEAVSFGTGPGSVDAQKAASGSDMDLPGQRRRFDACDFPRSKIQSSSTRS